MREVAELTSRNTSASMRSGWKDLPRQHGPQPVRDARSATAAPRFLGEA